MRPAGVLALALGLLAAPAWASGQSLTLEAVLQAADAPHPDLDLLKAQRQGDQAEALLAESLNDFRVTLDASLRGGRNDLYDQRFQPDHFLRLNARKTLWDAGRQAPAVLAADEERQARDLQLVDARAQRRLALMARYFDVLLAERLEAVENEFMAAAYVGWDNAKEGQALGQVAAWELAELEHRFQDARTRRNDALRQIREKRMQLAAALNRPDLVTENLVDPVLAGNDRPLPEFDILLEQLQAGHPGLQAQRKRLAAAGGRVAALRAEYLPSVEFEAEAAAWSRDSVNRDDLRAGLNFIWPLWQGGRADARLGKEQARLHELQAEHEKLGLELRQALLATREEILHLRDGERRGAASNAAYRDQALDRARAEYELELKANLGTRMAESQSARLRTRAVEYRLALAWARLEALVGGAEHRNGWASAQAKEEKK
jgi:outer membrane protein TolC